MLGCLTRQSPMAAGLEALAAPLLEAWAELPVSTPQSVRSLIRAAQLGLTEEAEICSSDVNSTTCGELHFSVMRDSIAWARNSERVRELRPTTLAEVDQHEGPPALRGRPSRCRVSSKASRRDFLSTRP